MFEVVMLTFRACCFTSLPFVRVCFSIPRPSTITPIIYVLEPFCLIVVDLKWVRWLCLTRCLRPRRTCRSSAFSTPSRTLCSPACRPATTRSDRRKSAPSYSTDTPTLCVCEYFITQSHLNSFKQFVLKGRLRYTSLLSNTLPASNLLLIKLHIGRFEKA